MATSFEQHQHPSGTIAISPDTTGGLISESFSPCLKSPKIDAKLLSWALSAKRDDAEDIDLAPIFGDLSQSEKIWWD